MDIVEVANVTRDVQHEIGGGGDFNATICCGNVLQKFEPP